MEDDSEETELEWLFCYLPSTLPDQEINWTEEAAALEELGSQCHSFDMERFLEGDVSGALEDLPPGDGRRLVYRGWILNEEEYQTLQDEVSCKGYQLLTHLHQYLNASQLPHWHGKLGKLTPPAVWTWDEDVDEAWELAQSLEGPPFIIKDHVKSCKDAWLDACYVPAESGESEFRDVCLEMIERRGDRFVGGIVVRPEVPLVFRAAHFSGMPLFEEYRLVCWRGRLLLAESYNPLDENESVSLTPEELAPFEGLGSIVDSPFFTADLGRTQTGDLILIELNDGGTSGLPPLLDPLEFYSAILEEEDRRRNG